MATINRGTTYILTPEGRRQGEAERARREAER